MDRPLTLPDSIDDIVENAESCTGMGDGSIVIEATTGGGQLGYSIDGGSNFQFIPDLGKAKQSAAKIFTILDS